MHTKEGQCISSSDLRGTLKISKVHYLPAAATLLRGDILHCFVENPLAVMS